MDVTFHETKLFFVRPLLYMEKTLEADELSFLSLLYLSLQVMNHHKWIKRTHNKKEVDKFFNKKYQRRKQPSLTLRKVV